MTSPTDGRITSLTTLPSALSTSDLLMVVSPGNSQSGVNYKMPAGSLGTAILDLSLGSVVGTFAVRGASAWIGRFIVGGDLPTPQPTSLGGVFSKTETATSIVSGIGVDGAPTFKAITGTGNAVLSNSPTFTGNVVISGLLKFADGTTILNFANLAANKINTIYSTPDGIQTVNAVGSAQLKFLSNAGAESWTQTGVVHSILSTVDSTSTTTGALTIAGGLGVAGTINAGTLTATVANSTLSGKLTKGIYVGAASAVQSTHTGDTNEFTLATAVVTGGLMGANGIIRVTVQVGAIGTAGTRQWKIKFGGTTFYDTTAVGTAVLAGRFQVQIANRGTTSLQIGNATTQANWATAGGVAPITTTALDTTANQNVTITGQLGAAADTIAVESYLVELILP